MKKKQIIIFSIVLTILLILTFLSIYLRSNRLIKTVDIASFEKYISAYTDQVISKQASIQVKFSPQFLETIDKEIDLKTVFKLYPSVKGEVYWLNDNTIEYNPYNNLKSNTIYTIKLSLNKLSKELIDEKHFTFEVKTIKQNFSVEIIGLQSTSKNTLKWQKLTGIIQLADFEDIENIKKIFKVKIKNHKPVLQLKKENENRYFFEIDSIPRLDETYFLILQLNGNKIGIDKYDEIKKEVPAFGKFKFQSAVIIHQPEQYIRLQFSDPLEEDQLLSGLIRISGSNDLKYIIHDNVIDVYPPERLIGNYQLIIEEGIKNIVGYPYKNQIVEDLMFEEIKPGVRFIKKGSLLPIAKDDILIQFEAVNLKAVDVRITKIFENNVIQFLQNNNYDGSYRLKYVGKPVIQRTIALQHPGIIDYGNWNRFTLDLNELIEAEPGAIYNIDIGFRKKHSVYNCYDDIQNEKITKDDEYHWDYFDHYWYGEYSWEHKDDPCHEAYYGSKRIASKNILVTNIGIIAKKQNNDSLQIIVNNIITTKSMQGVDIIVYNFQQQEIYSTETNNNGIANIPANDVMFILASNNDQKTYLKLNDANSLSLSNFDVSGTSVIKGLKGFIFGERGVWRPGDTLFLSFMLQENSNQLPEGHPILFQLFNPHKQLIFKSTEFKNSDNLYVFKAVTKPDYITGIYKAKITIGNTSFRRNIRIEAIRPNRLKIKLDFNRSFIKNNEDIIAKYQINWLHGSPANKLLTKTEYVLKSAKKEFEDFKDFSFNDPTKQFSRYYQVFHEGYTNDKGSLGAKNKISIGSEAPGFMKAIFTTRVFEKGGGYSIDQATIPFHPYSSYLGIKVDNLKHKHQMLMTDTSHIIRFVVIDQKGKLLNTKNEIDIKVYKLSWRWWWDNSYDNIANYEGRIYQKPFHTTNIITNNGKGTWTFRVNYPEWGRFLIKAVDKKSGHSVSKIVYLDWPGWISREDKSIPLGASMLTFTSDKEKYSINENINLTFPSSENGRALISIENGTKILKSFWVDTKYEYTTFSFKAEPEMSPNIYIHISLLQPYSQTINDLPIRLYGILPIMIEDENSKLNPEIIMPEEIRAETEFTIEIREKNGMNMSYVLAIVDEGILDLTQYKTPDPWNYFYIKEAIGVKTWDTYDWVIGSYGSVIGKLLSIGGDDEITEKGTKKADRFKPVVKFIGPIKLKDGSVNKHTVELPPYIGSVRTMLIAKNNNAYGIAEKTTAVKKPLMLLASLPRVLGPEEKIRMQVDLFTMSDAIRKVDLELITNDKIKCIGKNQKSLLINTTGEKSTYFELETTAQTGIAQIEIKAVSGIEQASYKIELDVRNPNPLVVNVITSVLEKGEKWQTAFSPVGISGTNSGVLEVSAIPPLNLRKRIQFLIRYPFGCIEQTTSAAFPLLYLENIVELSESESRYFSDKIKQAISKIQTFQKENGGFGYWPNSQDIDPWSTSYAGHFLIEAQNKGYVIPGGIMAKWIKHQQKKAQKWTDDGPRSQLIQSYRLYTLSLAGKPAISSLNHLREKPHLHEDAKWRLAAAYQIAGKSNIAKKLIENLKTDVQPYSESYFTYGSEIRDKALMLETLTLLDNNTQAFELIAEISEKLSSNSWLSTQTLAYSLMAISKYYGKQKKSDHIEFKYNINKGKNISVSTNSSIYQTEIPMQFTLDKIIEITNESDGLLHVAIILEGIPPADKGKDVENSMNLKVNYRLLDGTKIDPVKIEQGFDFITEVSVTYLGKTNIKEQFALEQIFPSGWEIYNTRLFESGSNYTYSNFDYQDIRDDRVLIYFSLSKGETKTYSVQLNSGYAGKYYLPTVNVEAMYDATINARKKGKWIEVIPKK